MGGQLAKQGPVVSKMESPPAYMENPYGVTVTYTSISLEHGEELCWITGGDLQLPEGLNVYDEEKRSWMIGIPWDEQEEECNAMHVGIIAT